VGGTNRDSVQKYQDLALQYLTEGGFKVAAAIAFWVVGRWLIGLVGRLLQQVRARQEVNPTALPRQ